MDKDEQELELEDEIFEEITDEEEDETSSDAALLDEDEAEHEFVKGSVDPEDLATGFDATIPTREVDVDEDTQGDEVVEAGGDEIMTQFEVAGEVNDVVHGDEIELDLEDALRTGRSAIEAPEGE
ncbi:MAG TPA: hypothetical protein VMV96_05960 [Acidimicrobiales bacterium]|nr:hypothetical protein [Acidimicrobiales bacterium]